MRRAAGITMLVFGVFTITVGLFILLQRESGATAQAWMRLALSVLLVAVGISVLKRRAYWWALLAAIAMVLVGTTDAVRAWQDPFSNIVLTPPPGCYGLSVVGPSGLFPAC